MNIHKISFVEKRKNSQPIKFELDSNDLTVEEFAELRFLIDLNRILEENVVEQQKSAKEGVSVTVDTSHGTHTANFEGELPEDATRLIKFLKEVNQVHPPVTPLIAQSG